MTLDQGFDRFLEETLLKDYPNLKLEFGQKNKKVVLTARLYAVKLVIQGDTREDVLKQLVKRLSNGR
jgi:hypothetical protein